jgi:hypothetical protein
VVRRDWQPEELVESWTLVEGDWRLVGNKAGATRLGFAALLKFFELEARFPRHAGEVPPAAVDYLAGQVKVDPTLFASYSWTGRTIEYHRAQVRRALGFREASPTGCSPTRQRSLWAHGGRGPPRSTPRTFAPARNRCG